MKKKSTPDPFKKTYQKKKLVKNMIQAKLVPKNPRKKDLL